MVPTIGIREQTAAVKPRSNADGTRRVAKAAPVSRPWANPTARIPYRLATMLSRIPVNKRTAWPRFRGRMEVTFSIAVCPSRNTKNRIRNVRIAFPAKPASPPTKRVPAANKNLAYLAWEIGQGILETQFFHVYIFSEPAQRALLLMGQVSDGSSFLGAPVAQVPSGFD